MLRCIPAGIVLVSVLSSVLSLTDDDKLCVSARGDELNNDFLVGTWYEIRLISNINPMGRSEHCKEQIFNKLTETEIHHYEFLFKILNMPTKLVNPLYVRDGFNISYGVLSGAGEGKIFLMDPKYLLWRPDLSEGRVYQYINNDYVLYYRCEHREKKKLLLSRSRNPDDEEVKRALDSLQFKKFLTHKFCSKQ